MDELPTSDVGFAGRCGYVGGIRRSGRVGSGRFVVPAARGAASLQVWHLLSLPGGLMCPTPGWSEGFAAEAVADAILKSIPLLGSALSAESLGGKSPPS